MEKIRAGVIGCGKFALAQHLPNCQRAENIELYHCSSRSETGRKNAERFGATKITGDYREVLNDPNVDMVILSVPHEMHMFFIEETLKAGKDVLCEKPMTMTMDEAYTVIRAVRKKGVKLCVDYNRRFSPAMVDMKKAYQAHRADPQGERRIYSQETGRPTWPEENATNMIVRINDESLTYGGVHIDWREGGGEIIGEGCHWIDLICWMFEQAPVRISAVGSSRLSYVITLEFVDGSLACIFFSVTGTFEYPKELIEIQHQGKLFRSECFAENQYYGRNECTVKQFDLQHDQVPKIGAEGGHAGHIKKLDAVADNFEKTGKYTHLCVDKGHFGLLTTFADCIINDKPAPIDEMAGMRVTYLSRRAMDSISLGHPLPVNISEWDMYVHL